MINCTDCPCPEQSLFNVINICRVLFYTPIILLGGMVTSVVYDYVIYKEEDEKKVDDKKSD